MLGKVLKYDLKSIGKSLFPLYAALLIMALVIRALGFLGESFTIFQIVGSFMMVLFVVLLIGTLFYTFFVSGKRYYKNLYSDEGYLTHTLPVKTGPLLSSKVISSLVYLIVSALAVVLAIIIAFDITNIVKVIETLIEALSVSLNTSKIKVITVGIIMLALAYMTYILMVFAGISLGHSHNSNKLVFSVVWWVVLYYVGQMVMVIFLAILFLTDPSFIDALNQDIPDASVVNKVVIFSLIANAILSCVYYGISYNRLKKLNLQ